MRIRFVKLSRVLPLLYLTSLTQVNLCPMIDGALSSRPKSAALHMLVLGGSFCLCAPLTVVLMIAASNCLGAIGDSPIVR